MTGDCPPPADGDAGGDSQEAGSSDARCGLGDTSQLAVELWHRLQDLVADEARRGALTATYGLGRGRGRVRVLWAVVNGPVTMREIAEAIGVDPPYATVIVDNLEAAGLVTRSPHPDDRRSKLVTITPLGSQAAAEAHAVLTRPPAAMLNLGAADLGQLGRLLDRLAAPQP